MRPAVRTRSSSDLVSGATLNTEAGAEDHMHHLTKLKAGPTHLVATVARADRAMLTGRCLPKTNAGCILSPNERSPMFRMRRRAPARGKLLPSVRRDCDVG